MPKPNPNLFTEQFKQGKKSNYSGNEIKQRHGTRLDKVSIIQAWLEQVSQVIMLNEGGKYDSVYAKATEACAKQNTEVTLAQYSISSSQPNTIFPFPNLSVKEIAQELEMTPVEITMWQNSENPFYGCRLKVKPCYVSPNSLIPENNVNPNHTVMTSIFVTPFLLLDNALRKKKLDGFSIELDPSPQPSFDDGCRIA